MSMKKILIVMAAVMMAAIHMDAQSLAGRAYYNPNIMADALDSRLKDVDKKIEEAKAKAVAKIEEERGRKPTAADMAEIDKEMQELRAKLEAAKKCMTVKIVMEFKSDKEAVMKNDIKIDDDALKAVGVGWLQRKTMKAALAVAPSTEKYTYMVNGDLIIMKSDSDQDTLRMSNDGKYLYGKFDEETNFKLTRTK